MDATDKVLLDGLPVCRHHRIQIAQPKPPHVVKADSLMHGIQPTQ
ncbi:hypothetical protein L541_0632 [Bordetella hinzii CA90 BAL1384]|nr:hypothetical protein L541_0632 [Bordetella hinzii CA90 BAL1384]